MPKRSENIFAANLYQVYQEVGQLHGLDAQKLLREALDGLYHEEIVTTMLSSIDAEGAADNLADRQELSLMLDQFVASGIDAEAVLSNLTPFCARDAIKSVSQILRTYLDQQKQLLPEVTDLTEQGRFRLRYQSLVERANRGFGAVLAITAETRLRRRPMGPGHGEA